MAFNWSYPDPLDPTKPSLIGGKLRNVIGTFRVYITEIHDAINVLRENIGQTSWNWALRPETGDTLYYNHYLHLQQQLDILIVDYGYNSVIDILRRGWSDYQLDIDGRYYAKYAIIQDFRDVCDALLPTLEQWIKTYQYIPIDWTTPLTIIGDLGEWETLRFYLKLEKEYVYGDPPKDSYIRFFNPVPEISDIFDWDIGIILRGFSSHTNLTNPIPLTSNKGFKIEIKLSGITTEGHSLWSGLPASLIRKDGYWYTSAPYSDIHNISYPTFTIHTGWKFDIDWIYIEFVFSNDPEISKGVEIDYDEEDIYFNFGFSDINETVDIYPYMIQLLKSIWKTNWQGSVIDKDLISPPESPNIGDRYIVASSATGDWSLRSKQIAEYNGDIWNFTNPNEGFVCKVEDENSFYIYNGIDWIIKSISLNSLRINQNTMLGGCQQGEREGWIWKEYNGYFYTYKGVVGSWSCSFQEGTYDVSINKVGIAPLLQ